MHFNLLKKGESMDYCIKKTISLVLLVLVLGGLPGCFDHAKENQKESADNANAGKVQSVPFALVNILDKGIYDTCHIKGSINVPYEDLKDYAEHNWDKDMTKIVVYCANYRCAASIEAAQLLVKDLGFKKENVWAYEGGAASARHDGLAMEGTDCKTPAYLNDVPQVENKASEQEGIQLISSDNLKEMLEKFAHRP